MQSSDVPQRAHGRVPYIALGVTSFAWGIGPIFIRHSGVSGLSTSAWRMSLAVPVMMIIAKVAGTPVTWPIVKRMAPFGVMFGLNTVCGFTATKVTTIAIASLIGSMYPVIVLVVAGRYLGETINRRQVLLSIFAVCGVAVVVLAGTSSGHHSVVGDLWAVAALLIWVVYFVMTKKVAEEGHPPLAMLTAVMMSGAVTVLPIALVFSSDFSKVHLAGIGWIMLMVLIPGAIGHGLLNWAHPHVDASISAVLLQAGTVVSVIVGWLFYSERLDAVQVVAGLVVIGSLCLLALGDVRRSAEIASDA